MIIASAAPCGRRFFAACLPQDPTAANVIRYNGRLYNITRIDTFERYKGGLDAVVQQAGKEMKFMI